MNSLPLSWQALRHTTLAQALEHADGERRLVSQTEWDAATQGAVAAARARGVAQPGVADVVRERSDAVLALAAGRDDTLAALREPLAALHWLARALPLAALIAGLVLDRVANAHRVDLLSPPLLLVLAWNLLVYLLLIVQALRRRHTATAPRPAWGGVQRWLLARLAPQRHAARRGPGVRVAADFARRWSVRNAQRFAHQAGALLHLCAAAWAAGIALSLLARGLVVSYRFGWESTFLDAAQVHALVGGLFAPLTWLFGAQAFTLDEIAATQNFAGQGLAGSRWVWMYVGLLALVVVLPRLLLAAVALWRATRSTRRAALDLDTLEWDALRQALPQTLRIGLCGATQDEAHRLRSRYALNQALESTQGDRLQLVLDADDAGDAIDAVLRAPGSTPPPAWQDLPQASLVDAAGHAAHAHTLLAPLQALLPASTPVLERLQHALDERLQARRAQALSALANYAHLCAALTQAPPPLEADTAPYETLLQQLDQRLAALYEQPLNHPEPDPARLRHTPAGPAADAPGTLLTDDNTALALGGSAGAAAGAVAGAKVGALIDAGTGGLTLGVGTALGALVGGSAAWALRARQKKDDAPVDARAMLLRPLLEAALLHYLRHSRALPAPQLPRWQAAIGAAVQTHWPTLEPLLDTPQALAAALPALLDPLDAHEFSA